MHNIARDTHQQLRSPNRSVACMQPTATITKDARSWHCQVRLHVNDLHEVCHSTAARQLR